jgi:hypothetical protein
MNASLTRGAVTIVLVAAACTAREPAPPSRDLALTDLRLDLALHYDDGSMAGRATITVLNVGEAPARRIPLQLGRLFRVSAVSDSVGGPVPYTQDLVTLTDWPIFQVNQIYLTADPALRSGESRAFTVAYAGYLVGYTETGMMYVRDHIDHAFTLLREDALAFPTLRLPSIRDTRGMPRRDFTYHLRIAVPSDLVVAAAVPPAGRTDSAGVSIWTFESTAPVPFLNVPIAPYALLERGGVRIFHFPADSAGARAVLRGIERVTDTYTRWLGPIERRTALTVMEIPEGWGSQASLAAGIIQTADQFAGGANLIGMYHELAHLWHATDTDTPPVRWNEGLATFLQFRAASALDGRSLEESMRWVASRLVSRAAGDSAVAAVPLAQYGQRGLTDFSYSTGALLFYALFRVLGDTAFDRLLQSYGAAYGASGSSTEQMMRHFTERSPVDVRPVFADWLTTTDGYRKLAAGETIDAIIAGYRRR